MAPVYWDTILAKCVAPLAAEGFPVATWTADAVARSYLTTPKFIKAVSILTREADHFIFPRVIHLGISGEWWHAVSTCTPAQMYKFCKWLRSSEGAAYLDEQRRLRRLEKKAVVGQNVDDVCYLAAMEAQLKEYLRGGREKGDDYLPASAYVAMDEMEVGEECYKLYVAQCAWRGRRAEGLSDRVLRDAIAVYGREAAARHKMEFMRDGRRREEMKVWLEGRMREVERVGDVSEMKNFRFYLNITCGDSSVLGRRKREDEDEDEDEDDEEILGDDTDTATDTDDEEEEDEEEEEEEEDDKGKDNGDDDDEEEEEEDEDYKGEEEEEDEGKVNAV